MYGQKLRTIFISVISILGPVEYQIKSVNFSVQ